MSGPKKRPGLLWRFFYGRRRRGFPWLLVGVLAAIVFLGLFFAIPGGADISRAAVEAAAAHVNADGFIRRLGGYEAPVRERGSNLSGGQRQLLAFARALAHEPTILVLDEATSSVDAETEWLIQDALVKLLEGRTALVIAHRLSTIETADRILVLHKGELREQGTHRELLARDGIYARLYRMQYAAGRPAPARAAAQP